MNYDKIILEMMSRIQNLEDEVKELRQMMGDTASEENAGEQTEEKTTTADIRDYIEQKKNQAKDAGEKTLVLRASEIHNALKLKKRYPMVCNAMRQCMGTADTVLHETASGYSSSLEIQYTIDG